MDDDGHDDDGHDDDGRDDDGRDDDGDVDTKSEVFEVDDDVKAEVASEGEAGSEADVELDEGAQDEGYLSMDEADDVTNQKFKSQANSMSICGPQVYSNIYYCRLECPTFSSWVQNSKLLKNTLA